MHYKNILNFTSYDNAETSSGYLHRCKLDCYKYSLDLDTGDESQLASLCVVKLSEGSFSGDRLTNCGLGSEHRLLKSRIILLQACRKSRTKITHATNKSRD